MNTVTPDTDVLAGRARGKRTDIFRPGVIDPADFEYVNEYPPVNAQGPMSDWFAQCDHCGARFIYGAWFRHTPTGERILVGHTCAHYIDTDGRAAYKIAKNRTALRNRLEREADQAELDLQLSDNPRLAEVLGAIRFGARIDRRFNGDFWANAARRVTSGKPFSERWLDALLSSLTRIDGWIAEDAKRKAEEVQPETPLAEGRIALTGTVVSHKWQDSAYGETHKMLVKLDDGNKVWGSVPAILEEKDFDKGIRVSLTATVTRSKDDDHFGFYKRPSNARKVT